jgi:mRNA interferase RelE/StbE
MIYQIEFKPRALRDLRLISSGDARRIIDKIKGLKNDLAGDVKRLTQFTPEYRPAGLEAIGFYATVEGVEGAKVVIYRVRHRRDAYS